MYAIRSYYAQTRRVFTNLKAVAEAAGGSLADAVKLNIYLTDLSNFAKVNEIMATFFEHVITSYSIHYTKLYEV